MNREEAVTMTLQTMNTTLTEVNGWLKAGGDLVSREAPLLLREYLNYAFWYDVVTISVGVCFMVGGIVSFIVSRRWYVRDQTDTDNWIPMVFLGVLCSGAGFAVALRGIFDLIKVVAAPRPYILDYLKSILS